MARIKLPYKSRTISDNGDNILIGTVFKVMRVESDTFGFKKYILYNYRCPRMLWKLKVGHDFSKQSGLTKIRNCSYQKIILTNNKLLNLIKKIRKIWMIFDIENLLWKSDFNHEALQYEDS